ncbi:TetR/AcrR family transcriptional regulator [Sedimentibacter hydroxybenzoicus DSM 7310]|uniref:TetR/AcrR family transcriptional regulator n=1 Tax=Sedimentibacter hydroxybenzoicus DSM 7310 TaxID=1123245 RepID=A0A974BMV4_SEDHY|nr:TetR/AcrR family transcriptional regulator [Sedimentibacter hydroxybenzoicus]NYB75766.1 TetR/AcrR family transcriptional regulator [Sedimentibacter hydroxybenzoicus DSM 7310]
MEQNIKQRITDTAYELFQEQGYDNTSVKNICEACGISKPTFYYYLKSKEELLSCFFNQLTDELATHMMDMVVAENYWEQIWAGFKTLMIRSKGFGQDLYAQLFISNLKENKGTFDVNESLMHTMVILVERAQKSGQIRNQTPAEDLYRDSIYLNIGYGVRWCIEKGSFDLLSEFRAALENMYDIAPEFRDGRSK